MGLDGEASKVSAWRLDDPGAPEAVPEETTHHEVSVFDRADATHKHGWRELIQGKADQSGE